MRCGDLSKGSWCSLAFLRILANANRATANKAIAKGVKVSFVTAVGGDVHTNSYTSIAFIYYYVHSTRDKESDSVSRNHVNSIQIFCF